MARTSNPATYNSTTTLQSRGRLKVLASITCVAIFSTLVPTINAAAPHRFDHSEASVIFRTSPNFLSFAIDSSHLKRGVAALKLTDPALISLTKHLSPAHLRLGGSAADSLLFSRQPVHTANTTSYFTGDDWLALHKFARRTNTRLLFDLNVLHRTDKNHGPRPRTLKRKAASKNSIINSETPFGKTRASGTPSDIGKSGVTKTLWESGTFDGKSRQAESQWDSSNAAELLNFCEEKGLENDWQLGNEPNAFLSQWNTSVSPQQLASDFLTLKSLLTRFPSQDQSLLIGPDVTRPILPSLQGLDQPHANQIRSSPSQCSELSPETYLDQFLSSGGREAISGVAFHQYYLDRSAELADYLSPATFDLLRYQISVIQNVVARNYNSSRAQPPIWLGETGSCIMGGEAGLTDTWAASFLWADKLGLAARLGVSVAIRQSLLFGNYALVDHQTLTPNPDWWLSVLYKRLVDPRVLDLFVPLSHPTLRLYAQCSPSNNITVFGINAGRNLERLYFNEECEIYYYALHSLSGDLKTKQIMLNHKREVLKLNPDGSLPELSPLHVRVYHKQSIPILPYSILFIEIALDGGHVCNRP